MTKKERKAKRLQLEADSEKFWLQFEKTDEKTNSEIDLFE
jgi:hypothetical protein